MGRVKEGGVRWVDLNARGLTWYWGSWDWRHACLDGYGVVVVVGMGVVEGGGQVDGS